MIQLRHLLTGALAALVLVGCGQSNEARLAPGAQINAVLEASDAEKNTGSIIDVYTLQGHAGEHYVIRLNSDAFDPYLYVRGPGALSEDNDDDPSGNGSLNARLSFTFPEDGVARIYATSFQRSGTGAYQLSVEQGDDANVAATGAENVAAGRVITGELAAGDSQLGSGEFVDTYPLEGVAGQQLDIRLTSDAFDTYVAITGPNNFNEFNDDDVQAGTRNSRLLVALPEAGQYVVHVTSYASGEVGAYRLEMNPTNSVSVTPGIGTTGESIASGRTMTGALAQGDTTLQSGEFVDTFRFQGEAGQRVVIDMSSTAFDSYLILIAPSGAQEDNDDAVQGQVGNARIETTLGETGEYAIAATSFRSGEAGPYTVVLQQGGASAPIANAGNASRRIFALMVGISDYPGGDNDLPFTAEDARKMRETLTRQGVLANESVMLIDGQATRAGVNAAFQRVAAAAGPNDLFLFFYSGHGSQTRGRVSPTEPDGKDETIELYDGALSDDQMATLFQQVHAQTALLVLDSCFSGGFARDVVSAPGVMGLFSSEEDLTSAVADKFEAGGYLSHFLQTGLAGGADENRDRVITAGELSAYVRREFADEARDVGSVTSEGQRNYQFPVVDRGAVQIDAPVLALR